MSRVEPGGVRRSAGSAEERVSQLGWIITGMDMGVGVV
jgi:hypothetical protein